MRLKRSYTLRTHDRTAVITFIALFPIAINRVIRATCFRVIEKLANLRIEFSGLRLFARRIKIRLNNSHSIFFLLKICGEVV
jgi:hypothetical protein